MTHPFFFGCSCEAGSPPRAAGRLIVAAWLAGAAAGLATGYHVDGSDPSCSDSGPGTAAQPWCTLEQAAETLRAGDTAWIHESVYHEQLMTTRSGSAGQGHIVFAAAPGEQPIIDGTGVETGNNGILVSHDYVKLLGLEVRDWNDNGIWVEGAGFVEISDCVVHDVTYGIGFYDGAHDFVLNRVEIYDFDLYGFDASPGDEPCYNGVLNDCVAHSARDREQNVDGFALGHGTQHGFELNRCVTYDVYDGFDISAEDTTLDRCAAYDTWNSGYKIWADDVTLVNCLGWSAGSSVLELDWDGDPGTTTVQNCTFMDAGTFTIWVENGGDGLHLRNSIVAGGDNIGLAFEQPGVQNYRGEHNVFHNDNPGRAITVAYEDEFSLSEVASGAWSSYSGQDGSSFVETSDDELFVDPVGYDLHLVAGSVAANSGSPAQAPSEDYDGRPRPQGTGYDIGAYELAEGLGPCIESSTALCLNRDRFRVTATYENPQGSGVASVVELTSDSGYLWFTRETNVEIVLKVLDGCPLNGAYWVYIAGLTDQGVLITVTDMETGTQRSYVNLAGWPFELVRDVEAFPDCP